MSTVAAWGTGLLIVQCMVCLDSIEFEVLPQACSQSMILHCPRLQSAKGAAALSSNLLYPHLSHLLFSRSGDPQVHWRPQRGSPLPPHPHGSQWRGEQSAVEGASCQESRLWMFLLILHALAAVREAAWIPA